MLQVNYRPVLVVLGIALTLTLATNLLHDVQSGRHAETLMEEVRRAAEVGDTDRQFQVLKQYLQLVPDDMDALALYGGLLEASPSRRDRWRAIRLYEKVVDEAPRRTDVRRRLAGLLLEMGDYKQARRNLDLLLELHPDDPALLIQSGKCYQETRNTESAISAYEKVLEKDPRQEAIYHQLAQLYKRLGWHTRARGIMDRLVEVCAASQTAWQLRSDFFIAQGDSEEAARALEKANQLNPDDLLLLEAQARLAHRRDRLQEAVTFWEKCDRAHPGTPRVQRNLANMYLLVDRPKDAIETANRGLEQTPYDIQLLSILTTAHLQIGNAQRAEEALGQFPATAPEGLIHYFRGRIYYVQQQPSRAVAELQKVLANRKATRELASEAALVMGDAYGQLLELDRRLDAFREAVRRLPKSSRAHMGLATALLERGSLFEALEECRLIARAPSPPPRFWLLYSQVLLAYNQTLPMQTRNWGEVLTILERAYANPWLRVDAVLLEAQVHVAQGNHHQAGRLLDLAQQANPREPRVWQARINLARIAGDPNRAAQLQKEAEQLLRSAIEVHLAQLQKAISERESPRGHHHLASLLGELDRELNGMPPQDQAVMLAVIARLYHLLGQLHQGNRYARRLADLQPEDLSTQALVLELALQGRDEVLVQTTVARLRELEGETGAWWRYGEAGRLLQRPHVPGHLERAEALLGEIGRVRPRWSLAKVLEGKLHDHRSAVARAAEAYLIAFEEGTRDQAVVRRLLELLLALDDDLTVDRVLKQLPAEGISPELARLGAEASLRLGNNDRLYVFAHQAVRSSSNAFAELLWLGQMLSRAGQNEEAEQALRRATALEPELPDGWVALITHLTDAKEPDRAIQELAAMQKKVAARHKTTGLALSLAGLRRMEEARIQFRKALEEQPDDLFTVYKAAEFALRLDHLDEAEPLLRRLLEHEGASAGITPWVRRELAWVLARKQSEPARAEALALIAKNRDAFGVIPADERARLFVQAANPTQLRESLKALEAFPTRCFTSSESYRLGCLYEQADEWERARGHLVRVCSLDPGNPEYLARLVGALIEQKKPGEAGYWLEKLAKLEPNSHRVAQFRVRLTASE